MSIVDRMDAGYGSPSAVETAEALLEQHSNKDNHEKLRNEQLVQVSVLPTDNH